MAIEKDDTDNEAFKEKLQTYQELKEQYYAQKNELKCEGLEQKSLTMVLWIFAIMYNQL